MQADGRSGRTQQHLKVTSLNRVSLLPLLLFSLSQLLPQESRHMLFIDININFKVEKDNLKHKTNSHLYSLVKVPHDISAFLY
jgi:hypothetical protein